MCIRDRFLKADNGRLSLTVDGIYRRVVGEHGQSGSGQRGLVVDVHRENEEPQDNFLRYTWGNTSFRRKRVVHSHAEGSVPKKDSDQISVAIRKQNLLEFVQ